MLSFSVPGENKQMLDFRRDDIDNLRLQIEHLLYKFPNFSVINWFEIFKDDILINMGKRWRKAITS